MIALQRSFWVFQEPIDFHCGLGESVDVFGRKNPLSGQV